MFIDRDKHTAIKKEDTEKPKLDAFEIAGCSGVRCEIH